MFFFILVYDVYEYFKLLIFSKHKLQIELSKKNFVEIMNVCMCFSNTISLDLQKMRNFNFTFTCEKNLKFSYTRIDTCAHNFTLQDV